MTSHTLKQTTCQNGVNTSTFPDENLKAAYARVTIQLAQRSEDFFGERGSPHFSIVRIFRRPYTDVIQCVVQLDKRRVGIYIKFSLVKENVEGHHERVLKNAKIEAEVTKKFFEFFSDEPSVSVPEMIAFFPEEMAIVLKEKEGVPLVTLIEGSAKCKPRGKKIDFLSHACFSLGNALKLFQKMPKINMGEDELPSNLIAYVDRRLEKLSEAGFLKMNERMGVMHFLEKQLGKIDGQELSFCGLHGDLSLGNMLVSADQVVFLDLANYRQGPPSFDPACFHHALYDLTANPFYWSSTINILQDAFFEGYQDRFIRQTPLFLSYYVRKVVNRLLYLSRHTPSSLLKNIYQKWQYRQYLTHLNKFIHENS